MIQLARTLPNPRRDGAGLAQADVQIGHARCDAERVADAGVVDGAAGDGCEGFHFALRGGALDEDVGFVDLVV